eukprot:2981798-Pleurochrysis_carterae.AAC.1
MIRAVPNRFRAPPGAAFSVSTRPRSASTARGAALRLHSKRARALPADVGTGVLALGCGLRRRYVSRAATCLVLQSSRRVTLKGM